MKAELIGESPPSGSFLFAFDKYDIPRKAPWGVEMMPPEVRMGFVYCKMENGKEERYIDFSVDSILGHDPYWDEPTTVFSPEEIERIVNLPQIS